MNVVLLIAVTFTLSLVHAYRRPCERISDNNAYDRFVQKHILQESFDTFSSSAWQRYLRSHGLCHRPCQSFIMRQDQGRVEQICNGHGWPLLNSNSNLCISDSEMQVYDIHVIDEWNCTIARPMSSVRRVIVACDITDNRCLPVHFERYIGQQPDRRAQRCRPR